MLWRGNKGHIYEQPLGLGLFAWYLPQTAVISQTVEMYFEGLMCTNFENTQIKIRVRTNVSFKVSCPEGVCSLIGMQHPV